jgi:hypothetical protein
MLVGCGGGDAGSVAGRTVSAASQAASSAPVPAQAVDGSPDPRDIDLDHLVPSRGRIDYVWYVPAGRAAPAVVVGWSYRGLPVVSAPSDRRYALTLWRRHDARPGGARWTPHTLFRGSPFPFDRASVRTADVTGDGRSDLLVTFMCNHCNHGVAAVSIFAHARGHVRRIYGEGFLDGSKGEHVGVHGRVISETWWGAKDGLVWFDEPGAGRSVCCPDYRVQTFLRWDGTRLHTVATRKVSAEGDHSFAPAMPRP